MSEFDEMTDETEVTDPVETTEAAEAPAAPVVRDDLQDTFDGWHAEGVNEDDMIEMLHNDHELSYPGAVNKLRVLKKGAGLTKARGHKSADVQAFIKECSEAGDERAEIIAKMIEKFGYTKHSAASTFSVQGSKLGLTGGGSFGGGAKKPLSEVVAFARDHAGDKRADFASAMVEELGYTESTAGAFYTYLGFAREYAKQELEAAGIANEVEEAA